MAALAPRARWQRLRRRVLLDSPASRAMLSAAAEHWQAEPQAAARVRLFSAATNAHPLIWTLAVGYQRQLSERVCALVIYPIFFGSATGR